MPPSPVYLIRVTDDDGGRMLWAAALPVQKAVQAILDSIPEGWAVSVLARALPDEITTLAMLKGEVRELHKIQGGSVNEDKPAENYH